MKYINSITDTIHKTPIMRLHNIEKKYNLRNKIFAKLEFLNPYGSIKDRIVISMIEDAERKGLVTPGKSTIIESTSGNTGIALAAIGRLKGYKVVIVISENSSIERRKIIEYFGADVKVMPGKMSRLDMFEEVKKIRDENSDYFWLNQYSNEANPNIHYNETAKEIWEDLEGGIDVFVSGLGTGGTISGIAKYLKERNSNIEVIGAEPVDKDSHSIEGLQPVTNTKDGFIPDVMSMNLIDEIIEINNDDAYRMSKELIANEGLPVGISAGANLQAVLDIDNKYEGKNIVFVTQDNIYRYLSTKLLTDF